MSSLPRILCVSALFCAQAVIACGGSTDSHGNPLGGENGENAGASNDDDSAAAGSHSAGASSHSAGASSHSAGASSAGRGNTAGAGSVNSAGGSAGSSSKPTPNGTKLSEIQTDAQALTICNRIKDSISDADLKKMVQGSCAISSQTSAASQLGTCEELQAECTAQTPLPSTDDGSCTADDIPDCDNVTVDEYVACARGTMQIGIEYLSGITCDTDLQSLEAPPTASACEEPFARCPEFAAMYQ